MKRCPECGNPSYDGAPVCGNCGFKFPKQKVAVPREETIFKEETDVNETSDEESTINIIRENIYIIGIIVLITLIVICGIILINFDDGNNPIQSGDLMEFNESNITFKYPKTWEILNETDYDYYGAKFFRNGNNTIIEYYNITSDSTSLKDITQQRISYAQENGDYVDSVETITLDGRNSSNVILENADGNYTRFVSMLSNDKLYVFKISGDSVNSITSDEINTFLNTIDIT